MSRLRLSVRWRARSALSTDLPRASWADRSTRSPMAPVAATSNAADTDSLTDQGYHQSLDQLYALRMTALSGRLTPAFSPRGFSTAGTWLGLADAPSLWPVIGKVTSSFGQREDPFNGEGAFHAGIDISAPFGEPIHATGDGFVEFADRTSGLWARGHSRPRSWTEDRLRGTCRALQSPQAIRCGAAR